MPSSQTNPSVSAVAISRRPPIVENPPEEEQIARLVDRIMQAGAAQGARFGREDVRVVKAPLRICPLGAHIDHQLGIVTGMTIDQSVMLAFAPAADESVYIESLNFPGEARFDLRHIPAQTRGDWANYVRGRACATPTTRCVTRHDRRSGRSDAHRRAKLLGGGDDSVSSGDGGDQRLGRRRL